MPLFHTRNHAKIEIWLFIRYFMKLLRDALLSTVFVTLLIQKDLWKNGVDFLCKHVPSFLSTPIWTEYFVTMIFTMIIHEGTYFGLNVYYEIIELLGLFQSYKIPRQGFQNPSSELVRKTLIQVPLGHLFGHPFVYVVVFFIFKYANVEMLKVEQLPTFLEFFINYIQISLLCDLLHYILHRSFHEFSWLYPYHKQHHEYRATIGIASEYSSMVESVTVNLIPVYAGPAIFGKATILYWLGWVFLRTFEAVEAHTGFDWGFLFGYQTAEFHDFHHTKNIGNFGIGEFWDWIFATNERYLSYKKTLVDKKKTFC